MERHRCGRTLLIAAAAVLVSARGGTTTLNADQPDLATMDEYGCGYGFWLGSPDGEVAVRIAAADGSVVAGGPPQETSLPHDAWDATLLVGQDLYANWCDDVIEAGEPEPVVIEQWPLTAGTITLHGTVPADTCPYEARATVTGLEATRPHGTIVELGDRDVTNDAWGCFAG